EGLVGPAPLDVADQDDPQQPVLARLVVQGPDRLDLERGVQAVVVELQGLPRRGVGCPLGQARAAVPLLAGCPLPAGPRRWSRLGPTPGGGDPTAPGPRWPPGAEDALVPRSPFARGSRFPRRAT